MNGVDRLMQRVEYAQATATVAGLGIINGLACDGAKQGAVCRAIAAQFVTSVCKDSWLLLQSHNGDDRAEVPRSAGGCFGHQRR